MSKVLLVNDCKFENMIMKDMLNSLGNEVSVADEYSALRKVGEINPDILICNLIMKETKGNLLIERIKDIKPHIKCYLSSSSDITLNQYKDNKVDGVIKTPVTAEAMREALRDKPKEPLLKRSKFLFCPYCRESLSKLNDKITFCPYCGGKL